MDHAIAAPMLQVLQTVQELDEAVRSYITSDWQGDELLQHWQAIRDASLTLLSSDSDPLKVPGEDSY
jgi:transcription termination factor NusB